MFSRLSRSVVFKIGLLMFAISLLAVVSMASSVFISDSAESDAYAVNLSGSLRMQSYQILNTLLLPEQEDGSKGDKLANLMESFTAKLQQPVIRRPAMEDVDSDHHMLYQQILGDWQAHIQPAIVTAIDRPQTIPALQTQVAALVEKIDQLVNLHQYHAEKNVASIRLIQGLALLATALLIIVAMFIINHQIKQPLAQLTQIARQIGRGDFTGKANDTGNDELALLGHTLNHMSDALSRSHAQMEKKVRDKTLRLEQSNQSIELLYHISKSMQNGTDGPAEFEPLLKRLSEIIGLPDLDLCVMTGSGNTPYEHLMTCDKILPANCVAQECSGCVEGTVRIEDKLRFPLTRGKDNYGVLVCQLIPGQQLETWQMRLLNSVAEQLAVSLSLRDQQEQSHRLALMHERTVIARELHDSLAQALSYLKIQVARLEKTLQKPDGIEQLPPVIDELKTGLSSAYRELRELLTTFRLKMDGRGLYSAMEQSLRQLQERSDQIRFELAFNVENLPFSPNEEIHLLQITREAAQNALHHSQGDKVQVSLEREQEEPSRVRLTIRDNGVGIGEDPSKLNHYGLAIMQERSRNLGGELAIRRHPQGGTEVSFEFEPEYYAKRQKDHLAVELH
ncbi:ATP-binding protein [Bowmanella dokdonensis]|uniref:Sensor protein n=1 Tax=Bowmanella dokdonensis TaxID=751969 RepID=A0A939DLH0_9ALTE|nr:ATP-binding protein [Bowmanella dokdonensis]MBN7824350.1 type IV pili methyl-accepting chemotaxis transducer N-terminal domain-containing protein [Bowmanella dokdonensis]